MTPEEAKAVMPHLGGTPYKAIKRPELMRMFASNNPSEQIRALQYQIADEITKVGKNRKLSDALIDSWYLMARSFGLEVDRKKASMENVQIELEKVESKCEQKAPPLETAAPKIILPAQPTEYVTLGEDL